MGGQTEGAAGQSTQQEFKDLLHDNEFLQDIAKDLGIEIGSVDQAKKDEEQKKKEEEDKK